VESIIRQLISRHESLRTSFEIQDELPVQRIHEEVEFGISHCKIPFSQLSLEQLRFKRTFDLSQAPLLRVELVEVEGQSNLLLLDMHHIISDGVSYNILEKEFQALYSGETLLPLRLQYRDYSEWQNSEEYKIKNKQQENYWLKRFEGEIPILNLPTDYSRPKIQSHEGARVSFALSKEETRNIKLMTEELSLTLHMTLLSAYAILLSKLSNQEDIIIGTPIACRNHDDLEHIVGVFVNTLAIRIRIEGNDTLKRFLEEVKQSTLTAYENQDYQFEDLVENVFVERDTSRNPLFDVMFNLLNQEGQLDNLSDFNDNTFTHTIGIAEFDMSIMVVDLGEQLLFNIEYCTKLFKPESVERYIGY
jgi:bacitracin synthase 3